jgi:predicted SAM-dependent methyltransferase
MSKRLNLGCGPNWRVYDYEGLDIINYGQKYVGDAMEKLDELVVSSEEFDEIMANHFLEHFTQDQLKYIFCRVWDLLPVGGVFRFVVPHKDKEKAWVLPHKTFWCEETVRFFEREDADFVYGFGKWKVRSLVVNGRKDIHAELVKV